MQVLETELPQIKELWAEDFDGAEIVRWPQAHSLCHAPAPGLPVLAVALRREAACQRTRPTCWLALTNAGASVLVPAPRSHACFAFTLAAALVLSKALLHSGVAASTARSDVEVRQPASGLWLWRMIFSPLCMQGVERTLFCSSQTAWRAGDPTPMTEQEVRQ
jgi:hypothetical protein